MRRYTSRQIAEWLAYERFAGPIDRSYDRDVLAAMHEQLQYLCRLIGAAHFTDRKHPNNPVPEPQHYPRAHELYQPAGDAEADN